tara:strand:- start:8082 stop:8657 length:576 start_codon:yes stop_codon:yes gene_type:complete
MKNKIFPNGRIHASKEQDLDYSNGYLALSVSPFDNNFDNEVEKGVLPHCHALIRKGYLPISSCEGHFTKKHHMPFYVMLAVGGKNKLDRIYDIINKTKHIPGISYKIKEQQANVRGELLERVNYSLDKAEEYAELNRLFMRNHLEYNYLWIGLFQSDKKLSERILRRLMFSRCKKMLLNSIEVLNYDEAED